MIVRQKCVICKEENLKIFYVIENFPIRLGVDFQHESCPTMDMKWSECQSCGCVQLLELADLDVLYEKTHNSSIGKTWNNHHERLSECILKYINNKNSSVLEIGGANLLLANKVCLKSNFIKNYTIIDLACGEYDLEKACPQISYEKVKVQDYVTDQKFDFLVHSHTFEHFYDPRETLLRVREFLSDEGMMIMSIPNISSQVENGHLNSLHFEHTFYYDDFYLRNILSNSGFLIQEIVPFSPWNNFYVCKKAEINFNGKIPYSNKSKVDFMMMMSNLEKFVNDIEKKEREVFIFGAHIFSQYIYSFGLKEKIAGVLDNDETKSRLGNSLAGTKIPVYPVSHISNATSPVIILKVSQFHDEIASQILAINDSSKIYS